MNREKKDISIYMLIFYKLFGDPFDRFEKGHRIGHLKNV